MVHRAEVAEYFALLEEERRGNGGVELAPKHYHAYCERFRWRLVRMDELLALLTTEERDMVLNFQRTPSEVLMRKYLNAQPNGSLDVFELEAVGDVYRGHADATTGQCKKSRCVFSIKALSLATTPSPLHRAVIHPGVSGSR